MPGHLDTGVQELVKVFAELPGGHRQLAAGASGGVDHLASRLVQVCCRLVQLALRLLEGFGGWRDLSGGHRQKQLHKDVTAATMHVYCQLRIRTQ